MLSSKYSTTRLGIQNSGIRSEDMATCKVKEKMRLSGIRSASRCSDHVKQSLQRCYLKDNRLVLEKCLKSLSDPTRQNNTKFLIYILDVLMAMTYDPETGVKRETAYMVFQDAYEIYLSFSKNANLVDAKTDRILKTSFKDLILHPDYGLCIYIVHMCGERYICLQPDNANISCIFDALAEKAKLY